MLVHRIQVWLVRWTRFVTWNRQGYSSMLYSAFKADLVDSRSKLGHPRLRQVSISTSSHRITLAYSVCLFGECRKRGTRARVKQATALTWAFHWSGDASCICHRFGTWYVSNRFIFQGTLRSLESTQKYCSTLYAELKGGPWSIDKVCLNREEAALILSLKFLPLGFAEITMQWYPQTIPAEAAFFVYSASTTHRCPMALDWKCEVRKIDQLYRQSLMANRRRRYGYMVQYYIKYMVIYI